VKTAKDSNSKKKQKNRIDGEFEIIDDYADPAFTASFNNFVANQESSTALAASAASVASSALTGKSSTTNPQIALTK